MNKIRDRFDSIHLGMDESIQKIITEDDVIAFSNISGDTNPIHLSDVYAKETRYKKKIAHGLLSASFFSAIFGTKLPGNGCVYLSQSLKFKYPVYIGDEVTATVTVLEINKEKNIITFSTVCRVENKIVIDGKAEIYLSD